MAEYYYTHGANDDGGCQYLFNSVESDQNNASTISLKATWKPTFEWHGDNLVLKGVSREDVYARDAGNAVFPLSSVGIHVEFAEKFGLLVKDTSNQYQLGPNLDYVLPTVTYTTSAPPVRSNQWFQWLGEHFVGIIPRDLLGGTEIFKVKLEDGQSYLYLSRFVDWHFLKPSMLCLILM